MAGKVTEDLDQMAEINVTPLVDVMLVLLIIFIITAPMLVQGLKVNLPKQDAPAITSKSDEPVILTLTSDQIILLGDEPVHLKLLPDRLGALLAGSPRPVYLKADETLPYGFVIRVLAVLDQVGRRTGRHGDAARRCVKRRERSRHPDPCRTRADRGRG